MHATIERQKARAGLFGLSKGYEVKLTVVFSEEEKAIIRRAGLGKYWGFSFPINYNGVKMDAGPEIRHLMQKPYIRSFSALSDAVEYENDLKSTHLQTLKAIIAAEDAPPSSSSSIEL